MSNFMQCFEPHVVLFVFTVVFVVLFYWQYYAYIFAILVMLTA